MQILLLLAVSAVLGVNSLPSQKHQLAPEQILSHIRSVISKREVRSATDDALKKALDTKVRDILLHGNEQWQIPVLDPLSLPHTDINLNFEAFKLDGTVDGLKVTGISTFVIDNVKLNILGLTAEFAIHVPKIVVSADQYDIKGEVAGFVPLYGKGHLEVEIDGLSLSGKISIGSKDSFVMIKNLDLDVSITALHSNIEGLIGGGDVCLLLNEVISDCAPDLLENAKGALLPKVSDEIVKLANEKLGKVTISDLLAMVTGSG